MINLVCCWNSFLTKAPKIVNFECITFSIFFLRNDTILKKKKKKKKWILSQPEFLSFHFWIWSVTEDNTNFSSFVLLQSPAVGGGATLKIPNLIAIYLLDMARRIYEHLPPQKTLLPLACRRICKHPALATAWVRNMDGYLVLWFCWKIVLDWRRCGYWYKNLGFGKWNCDFRCQIRTANLHFCPVISY